MPGALHGIRIVDVTTNVLGPFATQMLGDMGADVIKVEAPGGDPIRHIGAGRTEAMGPYFVNLNRNKRSLALDLKRPEAREALLAVCAKADVFVHNMRLGALDRLGFGYARLAAVNPRIIHAAATGYRPGTKMAERPAFDDVIQGACGLAALNGLAGGEGAAPHFVPTVVIDKLCGQALAFAVASALVHRERTGEGQEVHVPMMDTAVAFMMVEHLWHATFCEPERGMGYPRTLSPHRRPYATADGHICVIASTTDQWQRLLPVIGHPELRDDPRFASLGERTKHIDTVLGTLAAALASRPTAEWVALLDAADIPNAPVSALEDLLDNDYLREAGFFVEHQHPTEGRIVVMENPTRMSRSPTALTRHTPKHGEHTREVLAEAGLSAAAIEAACAAR